MATQEKLQANSEATEKALAALETHTENRHKFRLGFVHRHPKKIFMFSVMMFMVLIGYALFAPAIPFFHPSSTFGKPIFSSSLPFG